VLVVGFEAVADRAANAKLQAASAGFLATGSPGDVLLIAIL